MNSTSNDAAVASSQPRFDLGAQQLLQLHSNSDDDGSQALTEEESRKKTAFDQVLKELIQQREERTKRRN